MVIRYSLLLPSLFTSFLFPYLVYCFYFLCFILGYYAPKLFILAYREYLSADNANIYLPTPRRTIACTTRWDNNAQFESLLADKIIIYC